MRAKVHSFLRGMLIASVCLLGVSTPSTIHRASAAQTITDFQTWQFNGLDISQPAGNARSVGWCGGDDREGEDTTFEIRGNNGSSEWVIWEDNTYQNSGCSWTHPMEVHKVYYDKPFVGSSEGNIIYFRERYWSVDEDRVSEGPCGNMDGRIEGSGYWASDVICDGQERVHYTYNNNAQCGNMWVREHYICTSQ
jgi:hypothetical protein